METILGTSNKDRWFIVYSILAGFLLVGIYSALEKFSGMGQTFNFMVVFAVYAVFFDVRHFFPTYSRTLFDREFLKENKRWFFSTWAVILLFPMIGFWVLSSGEYYAYNSYIVLAFILRVTYILGFYHLIKQNWGFMAIYKKKFGEPEDGSDRWEKLLLLSGSFIPFVLLSKRAPVWFFGDQYAFSPGENELSYVLGMWDKMGNGIFIAGLLFLLFGFVIKTADQFRFIARNIGIFFVSCFMIIKAVLSSGAEPVLNALTYILIAIALVSLVMVIKRERTLKGINKEKWMVFGSTMLLYNVILSLPVDNKFILAMAITIPHNIQYLAFTKVFNQKYYTSSKRDHGFALTLAKKASVFFFLSVLYALIFEGIRTGLKFIPSDPANQNFEFFRNMAAVFFVGMVLHHYYLDAVIWRVRKDKELSQNV